MACGLFPITATVTAAAAPVVFTTRRYRALAMGFALLSQQYCGVCVHYCSLHVGNLGLRRFEIITQIASS